MDVLDRPRNQKMFTSTLTIALLAGAALLFVVVLLQTSRLSGVTSATSSVIKFGPLELIKVIKTPLAGGGYQGSVTWQPGIFWYLILVLFAGLGIALYRLSRSK